MVQHIIMEFIGDEKIHPAVVQTAEHTNKVFAMWLDGIVISLSYHSGETTQKIYFSGIR